ncbi:MAG: glycosyltransferase family 2 protein [Anaerolineae bacterium]|jgi:N-acetylglucosaminyl-diphospho-decaprenol L-rhamnosyltransferase
MPPTDLDIVIVNWNVRDLLRACLESILATPGAQLDGRGTLHLGQYTVRVYVVDNASTDGSPDIVRETFPWAQLIESDVNLGFTRGNNLALRRCQGRYVLLLNPDTRVLGDALIVMLDYMESHPDVGVLGPRLYYGDGTVQSSRRRFPTLGMALMESTILHQRFPRNRWALAYHVDDVPAGIEQKVDWVVGACMMVRGEAMRAVGLLDERFFMYSEELDWCRRIVDAGWSTVYLPRAEVVHYEGRSSEQAGAARHIHFETSKVLYFRKHHGVWKAGLLRLFLLAGYVFRLGEEMAKYLLGHRRSLRRTRMAVYRQVLRSRLMPTDAMCGTSHLGISRVEGTS